MQRLNWLVQLIDRMSGPAKSIASNLRGMHTQLSRGSQSFGEFAKAQDLAGGSAFTLGDAFGFLTKAALLAGAAALGVGYYVGKAALSNFAFKESALATGAALWGSADAAQEMFNKATSLARITPFNVGEMVTGFNKLGAAGFHKEEVSTVMMGLSDIAAMSGRGSEAIGSLTLAFSQIMGKGRLMGQELNQITEAAGGAVSSTKLFAEISKIMGRNVSFGDMENGLIGAREAIMGVMQIAKQLGGGIVGQNSIEQSKTLGGLWSNLEDTITNLWLTMDLTKAPWFKAVKSFLGGMVEALDTSTRSGRALQLVFERLFSMTIGKFLGDGTQDMSETIIQLALAFETLASHAIAAFSGLWDGLKVGFGPLIQGLGELNGNQAMLENTHDIFEQIGIALGDIILGFAAIGAAAIAIITPFKMLADGFDRLLNILTTLVDGTFQGLFLLLGGGMWSDFKSLGHDMGMGLSEGFSGSLQIHSPSKVFEDHGMNVVRGFERGVDRVPGMDATLGEDLAAGAAGRGMSSGAGAGITVPLTIHIDNTGHGDGDSIAQRLRELLPSALASVFDQIAAERGLAT